MVFKAGARRAIGVFGICLFLFAYIVGAVTFAGRLPLGHPLAALAFYAIAGVIWVVPLIPIFSWMRAAPLEEPLER